MHFQIYVKTYDCIKRLKSAFTFIVIKLLFFFFGGGGVFVCNVVLLTIKCVFFKTRMLKQCPERHQGQNYNIIWNNFKDGGRTIIETAVYRLAPWNEKTQKGRAATHQKHWNDHSKTKENVRHEAEI